MISKKIGPITVSVKICSNKPPVGPPSSKMRPFLTAALLILVSGLANGGQTINEVGALSGRADAQHVRLRGKADIPSSLEGPLMTQSGHHQLNVTPISGPCCTTSRAFLPNRPSSLKSTASAR